jgi:ubiquinone/menaquinone biosynthesis C-methylase UbiE
MPRFAARFYDWFLSMKPTQAQTHDVACDLATRINQGRLLDIGTGPGRLLLELHRLSPRIELFGLDISPAMIEVARKNLDSISVDLRQGRAEQTGLPADFFDLVTCTGSLYLWDYPEEGLQEIFRILKWGSSAYLFEVYKDVNQEAFRAALRSNLRELDRFRRLIGPFALRKALSIAARTDEYVTMIKDTSFAGSFTVDRVELGALPMWLRITLRKQA